MSICYIKLNISLKGTSRTAKIKSRIERIDAIIDALETTALTAVGKGDVARFELDTGQTKEVVEYNSSGSIAKALKEYEKLREYYVAKLQPKIVRAVDSKNLPPHRR